MLISENLSEHEVAAISTYEVTAAETSLQQQAPRVEIDDSGVTCPYANFCRVTGSPEELIIDFGTLA